MASALASLLRRLAAVALVVLLCVGFISPAEAKGKAATTISPEDMAVIRKQAEGFMEAKSRLPELASLVNDRDWTYTRNLIHGPMQEVGREMLYINQRLLPGDRKEANRIQTELFVSPEHIMYPVWKSCTSVSCTLYLVIISIYVSFLFNTFVRYQYSGS